MDAILYNLFVAEEPVDIPKNDALAYTLDDIFPAFVNDALGINSATTDASVDNFTFFCGCPAPNETLIIESALIASISSASEIN